MKPIIAILCGVRGVLCSGLIATRSLAAVFLMAASGAAWASPNIQSVQVTFPGGTPTLAIIGTGFSGGTVNVKLGGVLLPSGEVTVNSATSLTVTAAGYSPGDYKLRVTVLPNDDDAQSPSTI